MLKRICALCLVLVMGLSLCFALPVSAASTSERQLIVDLGIVPEAGEPLLNPVGFNRASLARALSTMSKTEYTGELTMEAAKQYASDVIKIAYKTNVQAHPYASEILNALSMGYMETDEQGKFNPWDAVTKAEVLTSLIKVLGYDTVVQANGGTEAAYLAQAAKIGLLKGVTIANDNKLTNDEVIKMVANAMGVPFIAYEGVSGNPSCLWEMWELSVGSGTIEANSNMGIGVSKVGANRVRINGKTLYSRVEVPNELVGAKVTYYMVPGDHGDEVVSIYSASSDENVTLNADDIESVTDKGSYLEIVDLDEEKILVDKQGYLMLNGKVVTPTKALFNLFESGNATFLDTDEDGYYDVIHMTFLYQTIVEGINTDTMTLRTKYDKQVLDFSDTDVLEVYVSNKAAAFSNLKAGTVVGIACDAFNILNNTITWDFSNSEYVRIYTSGTVDEGLVDGLNSDGTFTIDGAERYFGSGYNRLVNAGLLPALKLGAYVKAFYDNQGKLTYYELASGAEAMNYGYLIAGGVEGSSIDRVTKLKILDAYSNFTEYETAAKFILDGAAVETGSVTYSVNTAGDVDLSKRQLIRYRAVDGVVREIDTKIVRGTAEATETTLDAALDFDPAVSGQEAREVRSGAIDRRYAFTQDAIVFIDEASAGEQNPSEMLFTVQPASDLGDVDYYLAGYDANENNELACAVRYDAYDASTDGSSAASKDSLGANNFCYIIETVWRTIDSAGEPCFKISVAGESEQKEFLVPPATLKLYSIDFDTPDNSITGREKLTLFKQNADDFESLIGTGDIIRFTTNSKSEITYIEKLFDFSSSKDSITEVPDDLGGTVFGFAELDKTSGDNFLYDYGASGDGITYISKRALRHALLPLYHVKSGEVEMLPFSEIPSAATGNNVKIFIRYYNYGLTRDTFFYIYD